MQDDDGTAYIAYSSEDNRVMHIGPLTRDFTNVEVCLAGSHPLDVEAPGGLRDASVAWRHCDRHGLQLRAVQ